MIDRTALLEDLKRLVTRVEADLLARSEDADVPEIAEVLRSEYERARAAKRTADTYGEWREDRITQAAVAWVLSCVFVRFLEDNDLIAPPRIAGPGERLRNARDAHQHYFLSHPRDTDREYLLSIFDELAASPGTSGIFGPHNALREIPNWLSGDKAREVIQFFQKIDANTGLLIHDFTDPAWDTRFLGDLYQDLSAYARSRYALLQTPHFIEQFLLDRTLEPAIDEFGLTDSFKMIDPACGSGHLVLGSFERLLDRWQRSEPATPVRELVRRTLGSVHGVDINPFAVAIARFRLLLVAMRACGIKRLADAPDYRLNIECGDSLLHVPLIGGQTQLFATHEAGLKPTKGSTSKKAAAVDDECEHAYASENLAALKATLRHGQYHAVMANPPYITVRDSELSQRYRKRFETCHRLYSLSVPFMEHIYRLCASGGFTGQITANSFMKREFGKKLIEIFFPTTDLTHVIDTSGAYIPGHGTPTVILFGRRRSPVGNTIRAVMGTRGEPTTPTDPAKGLVWTSITTHFATPGVNSDFVTVADIDRALMHSHPCTLAGGGATELVQLLDASPSSLQRELLTAGRTTVVGEDDIWIMDFAAGNRNRLRKYLRAFGTGENFRDWIGNDFPAVVYPYKCIAGDAYDQNEGLLLAWLWRFRTVLKNRSVFGRTLAEMGRGWWEHLEHYRDKLQTPLSIVVVEVATHNHFVLDRGDKLFKHSTHLVKLPPTRTVQEHIDLIGVLNSSTACFWMKQVCHNKGSTVDLEGARQRTNPFEDFYAFNATRLSALPLPHICPLTRARELQEASDAQSLLSPASAIACWAADAPSQHRPSLSSSVTSGKVDWQAMRRNRISLQEELDWKCYSLYGLLDADLTYEKPAPPISLGERAFEIVMARQIASGDLTTTWFERHCTTPITDIPSHWPADYRELVQKRIDAITSNTNLGLIEQPEFKRRWNTEPWESQQAAALEAFLLDRLERLFDFDGRMNDGGKPTATLPAGLVSIGGLADAASHDPLFIEAAEVFVGAAGFDVTALVGQLVEKASVPFLPVLRYKATGLRKHEEWKEVWQLQRQEDAIDARTALPSDDRNHLSTEQAADLKRREVGDIPVPPKYASADFVSSTYWSLRGKLDVPKERFVSFPFVTGADGQTMIAWAGLDHLQLAKAIGDFYGLVQNDIGGSDDPRLVPLLAAIHELIPWIRQWHAGNDPVYGGEPADFFEDFLRTEAAGRGITVAEVIAWQPPARIRAKRAAKKAAKRATRRSRSEAASPTPESAES
ncbi:MAG: BREX-2 system adenine-specific DNA-methyltransferase PglX [Planctomycetia bacterium]|nr:BREX-2 system adenine-specific DNA-methyltransferase PglX [Planctomycetia bacterium]